MSVTDTSKLAYASKVRPTLGLRQQQVLEAMKLREDWSNTELSKELNWPINTVTPRVNELRKFRLAEFSGKRICTVTGLRVMTWKRVERISQLNLF